MSVVPGAQLLKDPDADLAYDMDWSDWLGADATIDTSTWSSSPTGLTLHDDSTPESDTFAQTFISGGTVGKTYKVTNEIVTDETPPQTDNRSFFLKITER